jgi:hypothetical protein
MSNNGVVRSFNHTWQWSQRRRRTLVSVREQIRSTTTNKIISRRSINNLLHIRPIKIIVWSSSERREPSFRPNVGTEICQVVDIEARVYVVDCVVNIIIEVAAWGLVVRCCGDFPGGWELVGVGVEEVGVAAGIGACGDVRHVGFVEADYVLVVLEGGDDGGWFC